MELDRLQQLLDSVKRTGRGVFLSIRGRRQVGKSRLVEEFLRRADVPSVFFTAAKGVPTANEVNDFVTEVAQSRLDAAPFFADARFTDWESMLRQLSSAVTSPSVVVVDELPFLVGEDPSLEGVLQRLWDRHLSRVPLLLIVVGSDLSMMEALSEYDRPLYQRLREMVVEPLNVAETAEMLGLDAADAIDAYLVHGGFPTLTSTWGDHGDVMSFLAEQLADSTSPLVVVGERVLNVEFPPGLQARTVLEAIGAGHTTFGSIGATTRLNQGSLTRTLQALINDKRVVAVDRPMSRKAGRNALYRICDPYLRFWLRFIGPNIELLLRDRGDGLAAEIADQWNTYRGQAVEPVIRSSVERMLPDERFGDARYVGSFWTRTGDVEVDLVGGRDSTAPTEVSFVGSIKWRDRQPFDRHDLADVATARAQVPGAAGARMVAVSRSGFSTADPDVCLEPSDLVSVWRPRATRQPDTS